MSVSRARRIVRALRAAGVDVRCQVDVEGCYELSTPHGVNVPRELEVELALRSAEVARYLVEERTAAMWAGVVDAILQSILATGGGWLAAAAYDAGPDAVARGYVRGVVEQPDLAESLSV